MKWAALAFALIAVAGGLIVAAGCGRSTHSVAASNSSGDVEAARTNDKPAAGEKESGAEKKGNAAISVKVDKPAVDKAKAALPARNISFDTIKFPMEKQELFKPSMITPQIKALDGRRVKIRGFMLPSFINQGLERFILVRDNQECCFGPGAALFDAIHVDLADGVTAEYSYPPIAVEGVFHIDPVENPRYREGPLENSHIYVFRMDDARVVRR
jgi:hypothetical protein